MRIGLFGGTFNPVHNGHIALAEGAIKGLKLHKIIFIPAYIPPHKSTQGLIGAQQRFKMVELAAGRRPGFEVSRFEIDEKETSYSVKTLEHFKKDYPADTEFFFLIGADSLKGLTAWKDINKVLRLCRFGVCNRPGFPTDIRYPKVERFNIKPSYISSTDIRERIKTHRPVKGLMPAAVEDYIIKNNLYKMK